MYDMKVDAESEAVRVKISGPVNQKVRAGILVGISNQLGMTGYSRVLMDVTKSILDPDEPVTSAYDLVSFMKKIGFSQDVRVALVYSAGDVYRMYFETVSNLEGLNVKVFREYEDAETWLGAGR